MFLIYQILVENGKSQGFSNDTVVVIAGLSNTYADYVTTFAEYQVHVQCYLASAETWVRSASGLESDSALFVVLFLTCCESMYSTTPTGAAI